MLALLALVAPLSAVRHTSATARRATRSRRVVRGGPWHAAIDCRGAAEGDRRRVPQLGHRAAPHQRAIHCERRAPGRAWRDSFSSTRCRYGIAAFREEDQRSRVLSALAMLGNLAVALLLIVAREWAVAWAMAVASALRIFGTGWNIAISPVHTAADAEETVVAELGLPDDPRITEMTTASRRVRQRAHRSIAGGSSRSSQRCSPFTLAGWALDGTLLGLVAPAVAVAGDMLHRRRHHAVHPQPTYLVWRWPTRWIERPMWRWYVAAATLLPRPGGWLELATAWLRHRLRYAVRMRAARYLDSHRAQSIASSRLAACRRDHGDRSRLGHELVLRYRELGRRHVELVGRVSHRHLA